MKAAKPATIATRSPRSERPPDQRSHDDDLQSGAQAHRDSDVAFRAAERRREHDRKRESSLGTWRCRTRRAPRKRARSPDRHSQASADGRGPRRREPPSSGREASVARAIAPEAALAKKAPRKPAAPISMAPTAGPMAHASDQLARRTPMARLTRVRAGLIEVSLGESDRLGEGGRANRDRERGDDEQGDEIGREPEQSVADRGSGEREQKRRHARPPVDPGAKRRAERDAAQRPRGQDGAQRKRAEARLIDEKEHDVGSRRSRPRGRRRCRRRQAR